MTGLIDWDCEYTDTFAGEANYCWVKRESLSLPSGLSQQQVMRKAKAALGLSGMRGRTMPYSDGFEFRPYRSCTVAFVIPRY